MNKFFMVFASWRMAVTLILGFVAGIPLPLAAATLQAWMFDVGVDLTVIGIFSLVGLPYALKFLWAPLMDRYVPPFMGRRRGWLVLCQLAMTVFIVAMALSNPKEAPGMVAVLAFLLAFSSSSHDIVNDAYRTELLTKEEYGAGSSLYVMGYRLAMLAGGGGALMLSQFVSWKIVYLILALPMAIGAITTFFAPEPKVDAPPPRNLQESFVAPMTEFFKRRGAIEVLVFLIIYKLDTNLTLAMTTPFMMSLGFTKLEIGAVTKGFGMAASIVGALFGGGLMAKLGQERALWFFGITQALASFTYMALAHMGHNYPMMVAAITVENVFSGMGIAAQSALMMSLCNKRFTATQYALLSSFMSLSRYVAGAPSGWLAKTVGWEYYFLVCALIGIPGLLLLLRYKKWAFPPES